MSRKFVHPTFNQSFKGILGELGGDCVDVKPVQFSFGSDSWRESGGDERPGWDQIIPRFDRIDYAKVWFSDNGNDFPEKPSNYDPENDDDVEQYLNEINEEVSNVAHGNDHFTPMMNYYYPVTLRHSIEPEIQQSVLAAFGGSCILVNVNDDPVLCLAGGGMDLSWDICWSYILCKNLPPTHFCGLPDQCEPLSKRNRLIIAACRQSIYVHKRWLTGTRRRLEEAVSSMHKKKMPQKVGKPFGGLVDDADTLGNMQ